MLRLKEIRLEQGKSISKLSALSGVPTRTIEDIERRGDCRISTARKIADALGVALDELYPAE